MKIIIASDSFKGSLTSAQVAAAAAEGILGVDPTAEVVSLSVADGGEGTAGALVSALGAEWVECATVDPLGRPITARYGIAGGTTAILDVASASGLTLLREGERDIMAASSRGTGMMILDAYSRGCRRFMVGLGGSATCDGGTGMLSALGVRVRGGAIDMSDAMTEILDCDFTLISDVTNPLCGPEGAARVFGPQKGATPAQVELLNRALRRYASEVDRATGRDVADTPGAGAAGGLGFAFLAFFSHSRLVSGADAVLDLIGFDEALEGADLVITGEGRIDRQTLFGKLPMCVCRRAASKGVPTVAIAGAVADRDALMDAGFADVYPIHQHPLPLACAMDPAVAIPAIANTCAEVISPPA